MPTIAGQDGSQSLVHIGTAGWSIPAALADRFATGGSHLERYARQLGCAEINSSFYRPHRQSTYAKWAAAVPCDFQFCVKMPKTISHGSSLAADSGLFEEFLQQVAGLGRALGALLLQLPPRRAFDPASASAFLTHLRTAHPVGTVALEPRHASWFSAEADHLLRDLGIARVAADPPVVPAAAEPGGDLSARYVRLHGSPRVYYSSYTTAWLKELARTLRNSGPAPRCFVIFDNTAAGAALQNALAFQQMLTPEVS